MGNKSPGLARVYHFVGEFTTLPFLSLSLAVLILFRLSRRHQSSVMPHHLRKSPTPTLMIFLQVPSAPHLFRRVLILLSTSDSSASSLQPVPVHFICSCILSLQYASTRVRHASSACRFFTESSRAGIFRILVAPCCHPNHRPSLLLSYLLLPIQIIYRCPEWAIHWFTCFRSTLSFLRSVR